MLFRCSNEHIENSLLAFLLTVFVLRPEVGLPSQDSNPKRRLTKDSTTQDAQGNSLGRF